MVRQFTQQDLLKLITTVKAVTAIALTACEDDIVDKISSSGLVTCAAIKCLAEDLGEDGVITCIIPKEG